MTSGFTACATNENIFALSVSILTSSPLLSCHSGSATAEVWRHIDFSRWRPRSLNTTSGFVFVDVLAFRKSKSINKPNFVDINGQHISIYGWDITTSGLEKQMFTILEFYFWFRSRPFSRNLHGILHKSISERPMRKHDVISIFQDGGGGDSILLPLSCLLMPQYSESQNLSTNQISST